jgi:hypothetical protein
MTDELRNFVREAVGHAFEGGPSPGTPPDTARYGGGDEGLDDGPGGRGWRPSEPEPEDGYDDEDTEETIGDDEAAERVYATLSPAEQAAVDAGDVALWEQAFLELYPDALGGGDDDEYDDEYEDEAADEDEERTGRDVVARVLADPDAITEMTDGELDAGQWLHWAMTCSPREWAEACREVGWDPEVRPGQSDLPRDLQTQLMSDRLDERLEAILAGKAPYL